MKIVFLLLIGLTSSATALSQSRDDESKTVWVGKVIVETARIKAGMTRADLLKVFTTEGGFASRLSRVFVYRACPYIKVSVQFEARGKVVKDHDGRINQEEDLGDIIKSISKPYLEFSLID